MCEIEKEREKERKREREREREREKERERNASPRFFFSEFQVKKNSEFFHKEEEKERRNPIIKMFREICCT